MRVHSLTVKPLAHPTSTLMFQGEQYHPHIFNQIADQTLSGSSWVRELPLLSDDEISQMDLLYQHRLGNLAYIDDMVANLIQKLEDRGIADNTYVIYTTDNGFHIGNHRMKWGKKTCYEEVSQFTWTLSYFG
jgi:arylsulfatase A-like enzyme